MRIARTVIAEAEWVLKQEPRLWLTPDEMLVYAAWNSEKRRSEWLAGRLAAKRLLLQEFGIQPLSWAIEREGVAPAITGCDLPGFVLSLSHSSGLGAATVSHAVTEGSAGIDVQHIRPVHPNLCARVFTSEERQQIISEFGSENSTDGMLLFWSLKEAAIKARRQAWGRPLQAVHVQLGSPGEAAVQINDEPLMTAQYEELGDWWLARVVQEPRRSQVTTLPEREGEE